MSSLEDSNSTSSFDNSFVEIKAPDNTSIGNVADSLKTNVTNAAGASAVNIQDGGNSITVDATSLPLPTGASTSALQTAGNSSLSSIDTKIPALGQALAAASTPVVLTAAQIATLTPLTTVTVTQATGTNLHTTIDNFPTTQTIAVADITPSTGTITAQDTVTITLVGANSQSFYTGTPTVGSSVSFSLSSIETVNIEATLLGSGGTMVVEVSMDGGTFWFRPAIFQIGTQNYTNSFGSPFSVTANTSGMTNIRVRAISAWTGIATIAIKETLTTRNVVVTDSNLPVGASTSSLQTTGNSSLSSIDTKTPALVSGRSPVDGSGVTQPISAASLPLPTGAATSANQTSQITALQIIDDLPHAQNSALVKGVPIMGQLDDTSTTAATEDNVSVARITAQRAIHTNLRDNSGVELGTASNPIRISSTAMSSTASAPTFATIGITSATIIASNANRKGLILTNTSSLSTLSINLVGGSAVLNSGITLYPHDSFYMDVYSFSTAQINGIASLASTNVAIQELT